MEALNQDCKTVTLVLPFNVEEKIIFQKLPLRWEVRQITPGSTREGI
jgi:hypothetical protein